MIFVCPSHLLPVWFVLLPLTSALDESCADEDAGGRQRDWEWIAPLEGVEEGLGLGDLGLAYQEGQASAWGEQARCGGQDYLEAFYRSERQQGGRSGGVHFGAAGEYIDVRQCKCADHLTQEG